MNIYVERLVITMTPDLNDYEDILDSFAVGYILGISRSTTLKLLRDGTIPGTKCGRQWRIMKSSLIDFLKANSQK